MRIKITPNPATVSLHTRHLAQHIQAAKPVVALSRHPWEYRCVLISTSGIQCQPARRQKSSSLGWGQVCSQERVDEPRFIILWGFDLAPREGLWCLSPWAQCAQTQTKAWSLSDPHGSLQQGLYSLTALVLRLSMQSLSSWQEEGSASE